VGESRFPTASERTRTTADILRIAIRLARPAFDGEADAHGNSVRASVGEPPWIFSANEVAARNLLNDILRVFLRQDVDSDLEKLCSDLINLEMAAAEETLRIAEQTLSKAERDVQVGMWKSTIETLKQHQLVMRSRLSTAALQREIDDIQEVAAEVAQVAAESRENAGTVGELGLATYFDKLARDERLTANLFRIAAIAILVLSAGLVYFALFENTMSTGDVIRHIAFVLAA
jgi:hypothetical protein